MRKKWREGDSGRVFRDHSKAKPKTTACPRNRVGDKNRCKFALRDRVKVKVKIKATSKTRAWPG